MELEIYEEYFKFVIEQGKLTKIYKDFKNKGLDEKSLSDIMIKTICNAIELLTVTVLTQNYRKQIIDEKIRRYIS